LSSHVLIGFYEELSQVTCKGRKVVEWYLKGFSRRRNLRVVAPCRPSITATTITIDLRYRRALDKQQCKLAFVWNQSYGGAIWLIKRTLSSLPLFAKSARRDSC
jgi:hypothetical protein